MILKSFLQCIFTLLGNIPFHWRSKFGERTGQLIGMLPLRDQKIAAQQLSIFLPNSNSKELARDVFGNLGALITESLNLQPALNLHADKIDFEDHALVKKLLHADRPIVALTAHAGNWELLAAYMTQLGVPLVTVGRPIRNEALQALVAEHRERYGIKTIWRGGLSGQRELIAELKKGSVVAALIDQDTNVSGVMSSFFDTPAATPSALIDLGLRHNALFVTAFCFRLPTGRFVIHLEDLSDSGSSQRIIDEYNTRLQRYIELYPSQWVWFHKRWRTIEKGRRLTSKEYYQYLLDLAS